MRAGVAKSPHPLAARLLRELRPDRAAAATTYDLAPNDARALSDAIAAIEKGPELVTLVQDLLAVAKLVERGAGNASATVVHLLLPIAVERLQQLAAGDVALRAQSQKVGKQLAAAQRGSIRQPTDGLERPSPLGVGRGPKPRKK